MFGSDCKIQILDKKNPGMSLRITPFISGQIVNHSKTLESQIILSLTNFILFFQISTILKIYNIMFHGESNNIYLIC